MARRLTREIYSISSQGSFSTDFALRDQIRKASISIMSNIAEGFERNGTKEFLYFLVIAKGSVGEVRTQLTIAFDQGYISEEQFVQLGQLVTEIGGQIGSLIRYLSVSDFKRTRYG